MHSRFQPGETPRKAGSSIVGGSRPNGNIHVDIFKSLKGNPMNISHRVAENIEAKMNNIPKSLRDFPSSQRLQIFKEAFDEIIDVLPNFDSVLRRIKHEYEAMLSDLQREASSAQGLQALLTTIREESATYMGRAQLSAQQEYQELHSMLEARDKYNSDLASKILEKDRLIEHLTREKDAAVRRVKELHEQNFLLVKGNKRMQEDREKAERSNQVAHGEIAKTKKRITELEEKIATLESSLEEEARAKLQQVTSEEAEEIRISMETINNFLITLREEKLAAERDLKDLVKHFKTCTKLGIEPTVDSNLQSSRIVARPLSPRPTPFTAGGLLEPSHAPLPVPPSTPAASKKSRAHLTERSSNSVGENAPSNEKTINDSDNISNKIASASGSQFSIYDPQAAFSFERNFLGLASSDSRSWRRSEMAHASACHLFNRARSLLYTYGWRHAVQSCVSSDASESLIPNSVSSQFISRQVEENLMLHGNSYLSSVCGSNNLILPGRTAPSTAPATNSLSVNSNSNNNSNKDFTNALLEHTVSQLFKERLKRIFPSLLTDMIALNDTQNEASPTNNTDDAVSPSHPEPEPDEALPQSASPSSREAISLTLPPLIRPPGFLWPPPNLPPIISGAPTQRLELIADMEAALRTSTSSFSSSILGLSGAGNQGVGGMPSSSNGIKSKQDNLLQRIKSESLSLASSLPHENSANFTYTLGGILKQRYSSSVTNDNLNNLPQQQHSTSQQTNGAIKKTEVDVNLTSNFNSLQANSLIVGNPADRIRDMHDRIRSIHMLCLQDSRHTTISTSTSSQAAQGSDLPPAVAKFDVPPNAYQMQAYLGLEKDLTVPTQMTDEGCALTQQQKIHAAASNWFVPRTFLPNNLSLQNSNNSSITGGDVGNKSGPQSCIHPLLIHSVPLTNLRLSRMAVRAILAHALLSRLSAEVRRQPFLLSLCELAQKGLPQKLQQTQWLLSLIAASDEFSSEPDGATSVLLLENRIPDWVASDNLCLGNDILNALNNYMTSTRSSPHPLVSNLSTTEDDNSLDNNNSVIGSSLVKKNLSLKNTYVPPSYTNVQVGSFDSNHAISGAGNEASIAEAKINSNAYHSGLHDESDVLSILTASLPLHLSDPHAFILQQQDSNSDGHANFSSNNENSNLNSRLNAITPSSHTAYSINNQQRNAFLSSIANPSSTSVLNGGVASTTIASQKWPNIKLMKRSAFFEFLQQILLAKSWDSWLNLQATLPAGSPDILVDPIALLTDCPFLPSPLLVALRMQHLKERIKLIEEFESLFKTHALDSGFSPDSSMTAVQVAILLDEVSHVIMVQNNTPSLKQHHINAYEVDKEFFLSDDNEDASEIGKKTSNKEIGANGHNKTPLNNNNTTRSANIPAVGVINQSSTWGVAHEEALSVGFGFTKASISVLNENVSGKIRISTFLRNVKVCHLYPAVASVRPSHESPRRKKQ